jgi:hypothetical protein
MIPGEIRLLPHCGSLGHLIRRYKMAGKIKAVQAYSPRILMKQKIDTHELAPWLIRHSNGFSENGGLPILFLLMI